MKLRHTFTYRWRRWRVFSASRKRLRSLAGAKHNRTIGLCEADAARIVIKKGLAETTRHNTLVHEVLHAVNDEAGIGLTHKQICALELELGPLVRLSFEEGSG